MKLFIYQHCPFCLRAQMIVGLKSLPVDIDIIMEGDAETPTRMVGRKVVPILQKKMAVICRKVWILCTILTANRHLWWQREQ